MSSAKNLCAICQYDVEDDHMFLPCAHVFHGECVNDWLKNKPICPTCKTPIYVESPEELVFYKNIEERRQRERERESEAMRDAVNYIENVYTQLNTINQEGVEEHPPESNILPPGPPSLNRQYGHIRHPALTDIGSRMIRSFGFNIGGVPVHFIGGNGDDDLPPLEPAGSGPVRARPSISAGVNGPAHHIRRRELPGFSYPRMNIPFPSSRESPRVSISDVAAYIMLSELTASKAARVPPEQVP